MLTSVAHPKDERPIGKTAFAEDGESCMGAEHTLLPGEVSLTLSDGTSIRFDSLADLPVGASVGVVTMADGSQCLAGNMKDVGPLALRASDDRHRYLLAPNKFCVTVLRDIERPLGKVFDADGNKSANAWVSCALARTVRCETHKDLADLIEEVGTDPRAALILDYVAGMAVGAEFLILSEAKLRKRLKQPEVDRATLLGSHVVAHERRHISAVVRFKENFQPSAWLAIDRDVDEHTPPTFRDLDDKAYMRCLAQCMPGIDSVTRVRTKSSSGRAIRDGVPMSQRAGHTFVQLADPSDKERLRSAVRMRAITTNSAWRVPRLSKGGSKPLAYGWKCLCDESVFTVGRLLFCGAPVSHAPNITIEPQQCVVEPGALDVFDSSAVSAPDAEQVRRVTREAGSEVSIANRPGGRITFVERTLSFDTELETLDGSMTVREAAENLSRDQKLRCQAPFRASESYAAFLSVGSDGLPFVHDVGTSTTYHLCADDVVDHEFGAEAEILSVDIAQPATEVNGASVPPGNSLQPSRRGRGGPLRVYKVSELLELPPQQWLIKGLLPAGGIALLYGESSSGKTFVAIDLMLAVARGEVWHGRKTRQTGVIYIAAEAQHGISKRLRAYCKRHSVDLNQAPFGVIPQCINLVEGNVDAERLIQACQAMRERGLEVGLIVIDTLNRVMGGADENTSDAMGKLIGQVDAIREATGATVLIVHHSGKNQSKGARGHSSLTAAVDTQMELKREGDLRVLKVTKNRDGVDGEPFAYRLEVVQLGFDEDFDEVTSCVALPAEPTAGACDRPQLTDSQKVNMPKPLALTFCDPGTLTET